MICAFINRDERKQTEINTINVVLSIRIKNFTIGKRNK